MPTDLVITMPIIISFTEEPLIVKELLIVIVGFLAVFVPLAVFMFKDSKK